MNDRQAAPTIGSSSKNRQPGTSEAAAPNAAAERRTRFGIAFRLFGALIAITCFALAAIGGIALAALFSRSRRVEYSLYPFAVILQVTPVIAIAPLLLVYLQQQTAVLVCAWIVAFFPVLANTTLGLNSVDRNLADLLIRFHVPMRVDDLLQPECPSNNRFQLSVFNELENPALRAVAEIPNG